MLFYNKLEIALHPDIEIGTVKDWRNNKDIWKWCRQHTLINWDSQHNWIKKINTDPSIKMFGIVNRFGPTLVGVCGFTSIDLLHRRAEFSLYIGPEYQGKGYGIKALYTLLRHGFEDWNFHKIWGETFEGNLAIKMFKKLGMSVTGYKPEHYFKEGKWLGVYDIELLRKDFKNDIIYIDNNQHSDNVIKPNFADKNIKK